MDPDYDEEIQCPLCGTTTEVTARQDDAWRTMRPHPGVDGRWCVAENRTVADARAIAELRRDERFLLRAHP